LALGLGEEVIFFRRRRAEAAAGAAQTAAPAPVEGDAQSDEEVLEELGAFDPDPPSPEASESSHPDHAKTEAK
jgi:hypothetical protein